MSSIPTGTLPAAPSAAPPEHSAIASLASHLRLWPVAVAGLALDLWSKEWAFRALDHDRPRTIMEGWLGFQLSLNPGALFGLGAGFAPLFVGASVLALMFVLYLFIHSTPQHRSMHVALGLVLAGALGNLYDRTMVAAFVAFDSRTNQRQIGRLISEDRFGLTIGDFETGHNARYYRRTPDMVTGVRPVVRDFIKIQARFAGHELWPWIFNVADALLVVGVGVLLLNFWADHRAHRDEGILERV